MINYDLIRRLLFLMEPERAHHLSLLSMKLFYQFHLSGLYRHKINAQAVEVFGLTFPNPVGLAAGMDKNGDYIDALGDLGFGFLEIGTVTPRPQQGNPKPRMFRLPEHEAIINCMGFNNKGLDYLIRQVEKRKFTGVLGINIGKNFDTPVENAVADYLLGLERVYPYADYITINLSSPNTPGLRDLQLGDSLKALINHLSDRRISLSAQHDKSVPLLIKLSPDMKRDEVEHLAKVALESGIEGLIVSNTTISRVGVENSTYANEQGGLSGKPVFNSSTQVLSQLKDVVGDDMVLMGVGGITDIASAMGKFSAGATLIQLFTGFVYYGPELIENICKEITAVSYGRVN